MSTAAEQQLHPARAVSEKVLLMWSGCFTTVAIVTCLRAVKYEQRDSMC